MQKLKPCPFCGGEAEMCRRKFFSLPSGKMPYFRVRCKSIKCRLSRRCWHVNEREAYTVWNHRQRQGDQPDE